MRKSNLVEHYCSVYYQCTTNSVIPLSDISNLYYPQCTISSLCQTSRLSETLLCPKLFGIKIDTSRFDPELYRSVSINFFKIQHLIRDFEFMRILFQSMTLSKLLYLLHTSHINQAMATEMFVDDFTKSLMNQCLAILLTVGCFVSDKVSDIHRQTIPHLLQAQLL